MLVVLLIEYQTTFDNNELAKIIASLVLAVNLFNSSCGVLMDKGWNDSIKNIYVYEFDNIIPNAQNNMDLTDTLREQDTIASFRHYGNTGPTVGNYVNALFNAIPSVKINLSLAVRKTDSISQKFWNIASEMDVRLINDDDVGKYIKKLQQYGILNINFRLYIKLSTLRKYLGLTNKNALKGMLTQEGFQKTVCNINSEDIDGRIKRIIDKSWSCYLPGSSAPPVPQHQDTSSTIPPAFQNLQPMPPATNPSTSDIIVFPFQPAAPAPINTQPAGATYMMKLTKEEMLFIQARRQEQQNAQTAPQNE